MFGLSPATLGRAYRRHFDVGRVLDVRLPSFGPPASPQPAVAALQPQSTLARGDAVKAAQRLAALLLSPDKHPRHAPGGISMHGRGRMSQPPPRWRRNGGLPRGSLPRHRGSSPSAFWHGAVWTCAVLGLRGPNASTGVVLLSCSHSTSAHLVLCWFWLWLHACPGTASCMRDPRNLDTLRLVCDAPTRTRRAITRATNGRQPAAAARARIPTSATLNVVPKRPEAKAAASRGPVTPSPRGATARPPTGHRRKTGRTEKQPEDTSAEPSQNRSALRPNSPGPGGLTSPRAPLLKAPRPLAPEIDTLQWPCWM